jgi:hypothetical protein
MNWLKKARVLHYTIPQMFAGDKLSSVLVMKKMKFSSLKMIFLSLGEAAS